MTTNSVSIEDATRDFLRHILPTLFPEGVRKNVRNYARIKNLQYALTAKDEGRKVKKELSEKWARDILTEFAPERYEFTTSVIIRG